MKIGIIGLGWLGMPLALKLCDDGHQVIGTKRKPPENKANPNLEVLHFEIGNGDSIETVQTICSTVDALVFNIPPSALDGDLFRKRLLDFVACTRNAHIQKAIFISSSGVFGNHQMQIDEETEPQPNTQRGVLLRDLETIWHSEIGDSPVIIRAAGLVGANRHPVKFLSGRTGISGAEHPVNLVHQSDLIEMIVAVLKAPVNKPIYHAVASQHPSKKEFYQKKAEELSLEIPKFETADQSEGKYFAGEVSKSFLKLKFQYDDPFKM